MQRQFSTDERTKLILLLFIVKYLVFSNFSTILLFLADVLQTMKDLLDKRLNFATATLVFFLRLPNSAALI